MEKSNLEKFVDKLNLFQMEQLQKQINIRKAELYETSPEHEFIRSIFLPRRDNTIAEYILKHKVPMNDD
jgi:hypothetical protein